MFLIRSLTNLLDKLLFAVALLTGAQAPGFILQYQQILGAHFQEVHQQLAKYQQIADHFYAGDITQLLRAHQINEIPAIRAEASLIGDLIQRTDYLQQQLSALSNQPLHEQLLHMVQQPDIEIIHETVDNYTLIVPLTIDALTAGLCLALAINILLYLLFFVFGRVCIAIGHAPLFQPSR